MSECPRIGKFFGGCRFEPRYSIGAPDISADLLNRLVFSDERADAIQQSRPQTYVQDVCIRCGKTAQRPNSNPANGEAE